MKHWLIAATALAGLAACDDPTAPLTTQTALYDTVELAAYRAYQDSFGTQPFADGALSVIATEQDDLRTFRLAPCGETVCAGGPNGPAGQLEVTPDYHIVRGLFGGREFWLSPGGDGAIRYPGGSAVSLAWNPVQ